MLKQEDIPGGPDSLTKPFNLAAASAAFFADFPARRADAAFYPSDNGIPCVGTKPSGAQSIYLPPMGEGWHKTFLIDYFNRQVSTAVYYMLPRAVVPEDPAFRNDAYWAHHVFDHECGHALLHRHPLWNEFPKRLYRPHADECFADLYAALRHIQRFGEDTGFRHAVLLSRARLLPGIDALYARQHMTAACLLALEDMKPDAARIRTLGPEQTMETALRLMLDSALNADTVHGLADAAVNMAGGGYADLPARLAGDSRIPPRLAAACAEALAVLHPPVRTAPPQP